MSNKHIIYSSETLTLKQDFFVEDLLDLSFEGHGAFAFYQAGNGGHAHVQVELNVKEMDAMCLAWVKEAGGLNAIKIRATRRFEPWDM